MLRFEILVAEGEPPRAPRRGRLTLDHGAVETPAFMPVGTAGTVKAARFDDLEALGATILLSNTYHLLVRVGPERIRSLGGLHRFIGWDRPILTDSGGFQVLSLEKTRKVTEEGVLFRSHVDGTPHLLTPERAATIQLGDFGVDVAMALDECPPRDVTADEARASMERTHRWARRGREAFERLRAEAGGRDGGARGAQFGIVQGGRFAQLREESAATVAGIGFEGVACGGVSVGEPKEEMRATVERTGPLLPWERPRYLMGVGRPDDLVHAVLHGFDLFDCVLPTRAARHGLLYLRDGSTLVVKNARYRDDTAPPDPGGAGPLCRRHSRAYLRHLYLAGEPTAATLMTIHNLHAVLDLMRRIREALGRGEMRAFSAAFLAAAARKDEA